MTDKFYYESIKLNPECAITANEIEPNKIVWAFVINSQVALTYCHLGRISAATLKENANCCDLIAEAICAKKSITSELHTNQKTCTIMLSSDTHRSTFTIKSGSLQIFSGEVTPSKLAQLALALRNAAKNSR
ncbi:hypothetical protein QP222_05625 [Corynebacterium pyruviciproducens]|uniref:hypothetical protein n=1 Tax=Corynebacterium pyruviciproducens TaxID=598660 RepID=UPI00254F57F3|nr:hypothetical protein [Corynebacterium pyruviciproducens]MDK6565888.1 hypothetical protein [Corynebacterium pyruviciproducens]